jgi:hypothetical protein
LTTNDITVRFGRRPSRGLILGFSAPRVVVLALAAVLAVAGLVVDNAPGLGVTAVLWAPLAAAAFVRVAGRPVAEWAGTAAHYGARRSLGQTEYRARSPLAPRPAGSLALPGDAAALRLWEDPVSGAAMIHDPHRRTLAAVAAVSHPAFVLLDADERSQRVARFGRLYAALAGSGTCAALQVLECTVPDPALGQAEWYETHGIRDGGWADRQYRSLLDQVRLAAGTHRTTITLSLDLRAAARAARAAGRGLAGAAEVLRGDMAGLTDQLRQAGLRVAGWLGEAELAAIVRSAYDPVTLLDPRSDPGAKLSRAGPVAMSERWDHLRHDSGYSAVLWVSEWPRIDVPPDFLHPVVFAPGVRRALSITARPLPTDAALRQIRKEKTAAVADAAQKARVGQIADLSDAQEYEDLLSRERSVVAGHTDVVFSGFVVVTASDLEDLDAARSVLTRAAGQAACELRPLYGRQAQGFAVAALPLARTAF